MPSVEDNDFDLARVHRARLHRERQEPSRTSLKSLDDAVMPAVAVAAWPTKIASREALRW